MASRNEVDLVELGLGRRRMKLEEGEFERWVRRGRVPGWLPVRYPAVTGDRFVPAQSLELYRALSDDVPARFLQGFSLHRAPWLTLGLLLLSALLLLLPQPSQELVGGLLSKELGAVLERGQWWRVFTYIVPHVGVMHLLGNAAYLVYLGWLVENAYGRSTALLLAVLSVGAGGLLSLAVGVGPTVGSSSLVFGWFGAVLAFGWKYGDLVRKGDQVRFGWAVFPYLTVLLVLGMRVPGIDNFSHVGGFFGGCLGGLLLRSRWEIHDALQGRQTRNRLLTSAGIVIGVVGTGALLGGPLRGGPLPRLARSKNVEAGYSLRVPAYWHHGTDFLGFDTMLNPTGLSVLGHSVVLHEDGSSPVDAGSSLARELGLHEDLFVDQDSIERDAFSVAGRDATEGCLRFYRGAQSYRMCRVSVLRGRTELQISLRVSEGYQDTYRKIWRRILGTVEWGDPGPLIRARQRVEEHPEKWTARLDLARELLAIGAWQEAWQEGILASAGSGGDGAVDRVLLRIALEGQLGGESVLNLARMAVERHPETPDLALLVSSVLERAGEGEEALQILEDARVRFPANTSLMARLRALQEQTGQGQGEDGADDEGRGG